MRAGPNPAEQRGTEDQAREQLPDDAGLAETLHDLAKPAPHEHEQRDLRDENGFLASGRDAAADRSAFVGSQCGICEQE